MRLLSAVTFCSSDATASSLIYYSTEAQNKNLSVLYDNKTSLTKQEKRKHFAPMHHATE